jgi:hypothetical protein
MTLYIDRAGRLYSTPAATRRCVPHWVGLTGCGDTCRVTFDRMDDGAEWIPFYVCRWVGGVPVELRHQLAKTLFSSAPSF